MNLISELTDLIVSFARSNPLIALVALIIFAFLVYRKPMFFLAIFCLGLLIAGVVYIIMEASSSGVSEKERLIRKGVPVENAVRYLNMKF